MVTSALLTTFFGLTALVATPEPTFGPSDVRTVFHIAKSQNRNQVHYGVRLDARCRPRLDAPILAYWRTLEHSAISVEALSALEETAYGIAWQRWSLRDGGDVVIDLALRALEHRTVKVFVRRVGERCFAQAVVEIAGAPARLERAFVVLGFFGVERLELEGRRTADRRRAIEVIRG